MSSCRVREENKQYSVYDNIQIYLVPCSGPCRFNEHKEDQKKVSR